MTLFGEDISHSSVEYKKRIGYVPEMADLYDNLTAEEYLTFMGELYGLEQKKAGEKAERLTRLFGLSEVYESGSPLIQKG